MSSLRIYIFYEFFDDEFDACITITKGIWLNILIDID